MANMFDEFETQKEADENWRAKNNPPEYQAGQGLDDLFAPPSGNESMIQSDSFSGFTDPVSPQQPLNSDPRNGMGFDPNMSKEEIIFMHIWKALVNYFKVMGSFLVGLFEVIKITTPYGWYATYYMFMRYGLGLIGAGFFLYIMSFFISSISSPMWVVILGILCTTVGVSGAILTKDKSYRFEEETGTKATTTDDIGGYIGRNSESYDNVDDYSYEESDDTHYEDLNSEFEDSSYEDDLSNDVEEEEEFVSLSDIAEEEGFQVLDVEEPIDVNDAITSLEDISPGMQNRRYLYEQFFRVLRSITPNFYDMVEVYPETEVFSKYNFLLENAAKREGFTDEDFHLIKVYENSFMYKLVVSANGKFKADKVGQSIENQERFNDMGKEVAPNVMVMTKVIGGNVHIDILKNEPPMFSVRDLWGAGKEYMEDPNILMPVALGSDEMGEPIILDFYNVDGIALSGMKGTGKSWLAQSIISQIAMFNDPNKVQFIIADPKGAQGDFHSMKFPHILRKVQSTDDTMEVLRWLMREEVPRRRALMGQYNMSNIKELHKLHPDVDMPFLYIVIEEMMSLGNHLQKNDTDSYKEYRMILSEIINNLRYVGVRLFGLSQRLTDNAVPKDAKVGIDLRMTAGADPSEVEQVTETKQKDFPYNISGKVGRYAIRSPEYKGGRTSFMIGAVLGKDSIDNGNTYRFIDALWSKLEPRRDVVSTKEAVAQEIKDASPTEMDDILNSVIDI